MRLVIDVPEEYYNAIKEISDECSTVDMLIIKYGVPLPKKENSQRYTACGFWNDVYSGDVPIVRLNRGVKAVETQIEGQMKLEGI